MLKKKPEKLTLDQYLEGVGLEAQFLAENKLYLFKPYPKQFDFCALGSKLRERLLMAGNQLGKSEVGAFEIACHATGIYPKWWVGKRFKKPIRGWVIGESSIVVRDVQQRKLCGEPGIDSAYGTGLIPKHCLLDRSMARGITDAFDTIQVRHATGGISVLKFKSYEQGRAKLQGETVDVVWMDEEPPEDIYGEVLARLTGTGICFITFTPLKGRSNVVLRFLDDISPNRGVVSMSIADVTHFTEEEKKIRVAGYAVHERDAREKGTPLLGSGSIYGFGEDVISEPMIHNLPPAWAKLWGVDFGIDHPFAYVLGAWDRDNDCIHIIHAAKQSGNNMPNMGLPIMHAAAMKQIAANVPVAWPHDGYRRQQGSMGETLAASYRAHGLNMLAEQASFPDGGTSREAAILEISERAMTGKFKVANHLSAWFEEFRLYHRKDGLIVRKEDDIMSATEKIIMAKRFARPVPLGSKVAKRRTGLIADGVDAEYFGI